MRMLHLEKLEDLQSAGEWLTPGDCVEVDSLSALTGNVKELLAALVMINDRAADFVSLQEGIDEGLKYYGNDISNLTEMAYFGRLFKLTELAGTVERQIKSSGYVIG